MNSQTAGTATKRRSRRVNEPVGPPAQQPAEVSQPMPATTEAQPERGNDGRFRPGNAGGPGNPSSPISSAATVGRSRKIRAKRFLTPAPFPASHDAIAVG